MSLILALIAALFSLPVIASDMTKVSPAAKSVLTTVTFGKLPAKRTLILDQIVRKDNMERLSSDLLEMASRSTAPIYLVIDSPGGSVLDGFKFVENMQAAYAVYGAPTTCIITGMAYSMAALIATFCHTTYISDIGSMMYHSASYGVQGSAEYVSEVVRFTDQFLKELDQKIAKQLGLTLEQYTFLKANSLWLSAGEAVSHGWVDGYAKNVIITAKKPEEQESFSIFGFKIRFFEPGVQWLNQAYDNLTDFLGWSAL